MYYEFRGGGGVIIDDEIVGTVPQSGVFTFLSTKQRLDSISIQGGVPSNQRLLDDSYTENKTEIEGIEDLKLTAKQNDTNSRVLNVYLAYGIFYRASTPITYNTYSVFEYRAPSDIHNVQPGQHYFNYTRTIKKETTQTPGTTVKDSLVPYDSKWILNVVGGNVDYMGNQTGREYSITTVAMIGISSPIQDDSYIVFEAEIRLRLKVATTAENLPDTNIISRFQYDF